MINILEIRPYYKTKSDGIGKYCQSLYSMFDKDSDVCVLPIPDISMRKSFLLKEIYNPKCLKSNIDNEEVDIVHINGFASFSVIQAFWCAHKAKKKIVYTAHWHPFQFLNHPLFTKFFFYFLLKPLVKRYADIVVTINNEDTSFFKKFHKNVIQIPHWYENKSYRLEPEKKTPSMVLFVGRVKDPNKGAEHLFHLPEGKYDIHCVGRSDGCLRSDMASHVNIPLEELVSLYEKASLLVVPSRYEAFSYVALEALSCGTPVLLSERVRIADYLEGVEGVYTFKYHDYKDFCDKVSEVIGSKVEKEKVNKIFNQDRIKELYRGVFLSLTHSNNRVKAL